MKHLCWNTKQIRSQDCQAQHCHVKTIFPHLPNEGRVNRAVKHDPKDRSETLNTDRLILGVWLWYFFCILANLHYWNTKLELNMTLVTESSITSVLWILDLFSREQSVKLMEHTCAILKRLKNCWTKALVIQTVIINKCCSFILNRRRCDAAATDAAADLLPVRSESLINTATTEHKISSKNTRSCE